MAEWGHRVSPGDREHLQGGQVHRRGGSGGPERPRLGHPLFLRRPDPDQRAGRRDRGLAQRNQDHPPRRLPADGRRPQHHGQRDGAGQCGGQRGFCRPDGAVLNVLDDLWVFRVTGHIPFKDIAGHITPENVSRSIQLCYDTLKMAGYKSPRIAVAALNPHAGDGGTCGTEEIDVLIPVIEMFREKGMDMYGPVPGDTIFIHAFNHEYDAIVTLFHDQGQIATKLHSFDVGITVAAGLPFAITTPEHGTAFDIAGKGIAKTMATERAIAVAARMASTTQK